MLYIDDRQEKIKPTEELIDKIKATIDFALKEEGVKIPYQISLLSVNKEEKTGAKKVDLNMYMTLALAIGVLYLGKFLRKKIKILETFCIPAPVIGGLIFSIISCILYVTGIIEFNFDETFKDGDELVLGDIVLSLERALEQSIEYNHSFEREASYLVVHSVLHLLGYDHMEEDEKKIMRSEEEKILSKMNIVRG